MNLGPENEALFEEVLPRLRDTVRRGDFTLGRALDAFESGFAAFLEVPHAVGVGSGTDALFLALKALGVGAGHEVITVANTFVATVGAIVAAGATPVFADVGDDENLDPDAFEAAITRRTRCVIPVHLRGRPARMDRIGEIAGARDIHVIEDCAQAHGARLDGVSVGSFGAAGCFSLHPQKILGAWGEAGVITTSSRELAERLTSLRHHGLRTREIVERWGYNSRLDTLQAAILCAKLGHLRDWIRRRRALARRYVQALESLPIDLPRESRREYHTYYLFTIQADERDALQRHLARRGVDARVHYPDPVDAQPAARGLGRGTDRLLRTRRQSQRILSLPIYPSLSESQLDYVADCVRSFYGRA